MLASDIRLKFLGYFEHKGHAVCQSSSLVPQHDATLLFTNAGMVQFKDIFLGNVPAPFPRATTVQKCVRAGGKHNDLENVGFTARHHTFFEMLGNFSFGDYFKKDAIHFAYDFAIRELGIPVKDLYVSVFHDDHEAYDIWRLQEGIAQSRLYRFGEKDNFWSMGETGPCGPCTELFIDRGPGFGCGKSDCQMGCSCDRFLEFWNVVFMQFDRQDGKLQPLLKQSVDTGAGLERLASILQGTLTNYETDLFAPLIEAASRLFQGPSHSYKVIADHIRASVFLIADGVIPGPEGRGYVLRRIIRRAVRHGRAIGRPFLHELSSIVIQSMVGPYPELVPQAVHIASVLLQEEMQFLKTLERGIGLFEDATKSRTVLAGSDAFKLYDTYGFPLDLTESMCAERGIRVDHAGFEEAMQVQKTTSRKHWKGNEGDSLAPLLHALQGKQSFFDREHLEVSGTCLFVHETDGVIQCGIDQTPFYPAGGGQVGDQGWVKTEHFSGEVLECERRQDVFVLRIKPLVGTLQQGDQVHQICNGVTRYRSSCHHTATHLLQAALQKVVGSTITQAGSQVDASALRFDFTSGPLEDCILRSVEDLVNEQIARDLPVLCEEMAKEKALALGAMAFFGDKYGDQVRVVRAGDFSLELCGGTHVARTSMLGCFQIIRESGIAAGVRRIEAVASQGLLQHARIQQERLRAIEGVLGLEVMPRIEKLLRAEKRLPIIEEELGALLRGQIAHELWSHAKVHGEVSFISALVEPCDLRALIESMTATKPSIIIVGVKNIPFQVVIGSSSKQFQAHGLLRTYGSLMQAKGGGKAHLAQCAADPEGFLAFSQAVEVAIIEHCRLP